MSRSVKPKKTRPANIARATGTGNHIFDNGINKNDIKGDKDNLKDLY